VRYKESDKYSKTIGDVKTKLKGRLFLSKLLIFAAMVLDKDSEIMIS
jgi:hypothetical protein